MKKVYLSILLVGLGINLSFGQRAQRSVVSIEKSEVQAKKEHTKPTEKALGFQFWGDDFSIPGTWTTDNAGQVAPYGWNIGTTVNTWWGAFAGGINSSSGAEFAEVNNGNYNLNTQMTNVEYMMTTTLPIDIQTLAGTELVTLSFEQYGALFNDGQEVQISTDGTNFTTVYTNNDRTVFIGNNPSAVYANPELISVNIASYIAGNSSSVYIRFLWNSRFSSQSDLNAWTTFGWFIDDVALTTNPEYDLDVTSTYWGSLFLNYYQIPTTQVAPIEFTANVFNGGTQSMTNVQLNVDVDGGTFTGTSLPVNIASLGSDSLVLTTLYTPAATVGAHTITRTLTADLADDVPANNSMAPISFNVTNYIYARDNGVLEGTTSNGATDGFEVGNLYDIYADQTLGAINVRLRGGAGYTVVGTEIYAKLYSIDPATGDFVFESESLPLVVASSNLNTNLIMRLIDPVNLATGMTYLAVVGTAGPGLYVSNAGVSDPQTSFFQDLADGTWYYETSTPYVRLNFDPSVGIEENTSSISIGNIYPNPTSGATTINYSVLNASNVTINIVDITGKTVYSVNNGTMAAGAHEATFNAASFSNGVYYVTISTDEAIVTKKFIKK